jgi:hypothetical protein
MRFPVKLFTIKGNLVFMNNLYHQIAVASVCTALGFALGANKEASSATITLTPATSFAVIDRNQDGGDSYYVGVPFSVGYTYDNQSLQDIETRAFYEFNIANLSLASNTVISRAIFQVRADLLIPHHRSFGVDILAYKGNGQPDVSDFYAQTYASSYSNLGGGFLEPSFNSYFNVHMTEFVNELISNNDAFAGFKVRQVNGGGDAIFNHRDASLIITTVDVAEPVPEPTTIFGSALALSLGGWLKRNNSSGPNKTTPQH